MKGALRDSDQGYQIVKILFLDGHMTYPVDQTKYRNLMMTLDLKQYTYVSTIPLVPVEIELVNILSQLTKCKLKL